MGVIFTHAYCQQAVSNPSRASLLTGFRPDSTGVTDLFTDFRKIIPDAITLPQFKNNGYFTENIGKIFHNNIQDSASWNQMVYLDNYPFDPDAVYRDPKNIELVNKRINELRKLCQARLKEDLTKNNHDCLNMGTTHRLAMWMNR